MKCWLPPGVARPTPLYGDFRRELFRRARFVRTRSLADVRSRAEAFPWFEAHQEDAEHQRLIGVIESPDTDAQIELFRILQTLDGVRDVSLVVHRFESSADDAEF